MQRVLHPSLRDRRKIKRWLQLLHQQNSGRSRTPCMDTNKAISFPCRCGTIQTGQYLGTLQAMCWLSSKAYRGIGSLVIASAVGRSHIAAISPRAWQRSLLRNCSLDRLQLGGLWDSHFSFASMLLFPDRDFKFGFAYLFVGPLQNVTHAV